jgi:hypothetical protein
MQMVIAGSKLDGPDKCRLKLHEEYGRVWLYACDEKGRSLQNGRLLCIDDDGRLRIHCKYHWNERERSYFLELPTPIKARGEAEDVEIKIKFTRQGD